MGIEFSRHQSAALLLALFLSVAVLPLFVHAQADLQTSVRNALLRDPRTASLSASQVDAMVQVLVDEAASRGITSYDIDWQPRRETTFVATEPVVACGGIPAPLCALNTAFGFDGSDPTIAIGLGITSGILLVIIGLMLWRTRRPSSPITPPPAFR